MKFYVACAVVLLSLSHSSFAEQQQDFGSNSPPTPTYEMKPAEVQLASGVRDLTEAKFQSSIAGHAATGRYCRIENKRVVDEMKGSPHLVMKNGQSVFELEIKCKTSDGSAYSDNCRIVDYIWVVRYQIPVNVTVTEENYTNFIDNKDAPERPWRVMRECRSETPSYGYGSGRSGGGYEPYRLPPPQPLYLGNGVWLR